MKKLITLILGITLAYSCSTSSDGNGNSTTTVVPTLTTITISSITASTAVSGGTITNDGGATITDRGVCWSTSANPTIALSTKTTDGAGTGVFISNITGLTAGTTYYVRAYATNGVGTAYGNEVSFITLQNSSPCDDTTTPYPTVTIGGQVWMQKNLNVCKYQNGDDIPQVQDPTAWANLTTGAWCYYENNTVNGPIYGKLYNWYAVVGIYDAASATNPALRKKLAPTGWHVPSDAEWTTLTTFLGGESVAGGKMKSTGTSLWLSPNTSATNSSGFIGLPGGYRDRNGIFATIGSNGWWWSSSDNAPNFALFRYLHFNSGGVYSSYDNKTDGFSVRFVKD